MLSEQFQFRLLSAECEPLAKGSFRPNSMFIQVWRWGGKGVVLEDSTGPSARPPGAADAGAASMEGPWELLFESVPTQVRPSGPQGVAMMHGYEAQFNDPIFQLNLMPDNDDEDLLRMRDEARLKDRACADLAEGVAALDEPAKRGLAITATRER